jgi:hypothetical protein
MKTAVAETSIRAYRAIKDLSHCQRVVVNTMQPGVLYSRRELEALTGMRSGPVCGRVAELLEAGLIEIPGEKVCNMSGKHVEALKLATVQRRLF